MNLSLRGSGLYNENTARGQSGSIHEAAHHQPHYFDNLEMIDAAFVPEKYTLDSEETKI
jgi:hypothetical protein